MRKVIQLLVFLFFTLSLWAGGNIQETYQFGIRNPSFSPDGNAIAFTRWGEDALYLYSLKENKITAISNSPCSGKFFAFSPDSKKLLFKRLVKDGDKTVQAAVEYNLLNQKFVTLVKGNTVGNPSSSRDGMLCVTKDTKLFCFNGEKRKEFELNQYINLVPINPDGKTAVYVDDNSDLILLDLSTGEKQIVGFGLFLPKFSPSGRFLTLLNMGDTLVLIDLAENKRINIGFGSNPAFLPDESGIIFSRSETEAYTLLNSSLFLYRMDTGSIDEIYGSTRKFISYPSVSPSGHQITYIDIETGALILAEFDPILARITHERVLVHRDDIPPDEGGRILTIPTATLSEVDVPYIHQLYDTPNWFDGNWSCGPTSCMMAVQRYRKLSDHDITCSSPYSHTSHWGWYIPNEYSYNGHTYNILGSSPSGWVKGAHGFICRSAGAAGWSYMITFLNQHNLSSGQHSVSWSWYTGEINDYLWITFKELLSSFLNKNIAICLG